MSQKSPLLLNNFTARRFKPQSSSFHMSKLVHKRQLCLRAAQTLKRLRISKEKDFDFGFFVNTSLVELFEKKVMEKKQQKNW